MAIDTAEKRFSAINHGNPWRGVNVVPTGTVDEDERAACCYMYNGIVFGSAPPPTPGNATEEFFLLFAHRWIR